MLIDHAHLTRQTFGDAELARELLGLFAEQCRRLVPGIADDALPDAERADLAHTLKGSAMGIGAVRIADLCGMIEGALRRGEPTGQALPDLRAAQAATLAEIGLP